jgi:hypothetical protein
MPSFKERFRPSRKYKKTKEAAALASAGVTDESNTIVSGILTNSANLPSACANTTVSAKVNLVSTPSLPTPISIANASNSTSEEQTGSATSSSSYHSIDLREC